MARRKTRTVYRTVRRRARYKRGGGKGGNILTGIIAGVAGVFLAKFIGQYGIPAGAVAVGWWKNNQVLQVEGARELGIMLGQQLPFIGGGNVGGGGAY